MDSLRISIGFREDSLTVSVGFRQDSARIPLKDFLRIPQGFPQGSYGLQRSSSGFPKISEGFPEDPLKISCGFLKDSKIPKDSQGLNSKGLLKDSLGLPRDS